MNNTSNRTFAKLATIYKFEKDQISTVPKCSVREPNNGLRFIK